MAFNDLSANAQEGLNYAANQNKRPNGTQIFATGREFADGQLETIGQEWYEKKQTALRERRAAKIAANATLAAQIDALPDVP